MVARTRGDPKRVLRGGGKSSGMLSIARGCSQPRQPLELRGVDAAADAPRIDQPSVGIVIGEQHGADVGALAFGIGRADHHESGLPLSGACVSQPSTRR